MEFGSSNLHTLKYATGLTLQIGDAGRRRPMGAMIDCGAAPAARLID